MGIFNMFLVVMVFLLIWAFGREVMTKSEKYRFNPDEMHHYDVMLLLVMFPLWIELFILTGIRLYEIIAILQLTISVYVANDDLRQHAKQVNDPGYRSWLVVKTSKFWDWFYKSEKPR